MNGDAEDPYEILGTTPDATETEVKVAAAKAKRELNPDHFPDDEKRRARQKLYRVREAERAILEDREMEPVADWAADDSETKTASDATATDTDTADATTTEDTSRTTKLSVEVDPARPTVGTAVSFRVTDGDGAPVRGASVSVAGQTLSTDASGVASTTLEDSGSIRVRATKTEPSVRYEPATATIRVTPGDGIDLGVVGDESGDVERDRNGRLRVESGETVTFEVESEETGRPTSGATVAAVYAGGAESDGDNRARPTARTDDDGRASLTFPRSGRATVRATDDDTESGEIEVVVLRGDGGRQRGGAEPTSGFGGSALGRLAARAVGTLLVVALGGLIGLVVVADGIPTVAVAVGGAVVAAGLLGYLWLVAR